MFAFDGYHHQTQGFNIGITDALFNLFPNQILVPTVATILTKLAAHLTLKIFGSYQSGDQGTKIVCASTVIPTTFVYINMLLTMYVIPMHFFNHIYPQMVNGNVEYQC